MGLALAHSSKEHSPCGGKGMGAGVGNVWSLCSYSQEAEKRECWCSLPFFFLFSPAYGMVPSTVEWAFLYSLGNLRGHTNRIVSNPNPIRVTININHQTYYLDIKNKVLRKRVWLKFRTLYSSPVLDLGGTIPWVGSWTENKIIKEKSRWVPAFPSLHFPIYPEQAIRIMPLPPQPPITPATTPVCHICTLKPCPTVSLSSLKLLFTGNCAIMTRKRINTNAQLSPRSTCRQI